MTVHQTTEHQHAFEIYLAWSDTTLKVRPGQTGPQALVEDGVAIEPGYHTGGCGMCAIAYVKGDIIHKDGCLTTSDRERYFSP